MCKEDRERMIDIGLTDEVGNTPGKGDRKRFRGEERDYLYIRGKEERSPQAIYNISESLLEIAIK